MEEPEPSKELVAPWEDMDELPGTVDEGEEEIRPAFKDENSPFYGVLPEWKNFKPTSARPIPALRCHVTKRDGTPCGNYALRGSGLATGRGVCRNHGGMLPNVKAYSEAVVEAARMRLMENADLATDTMVSLMATGKADNIRLAAAKELLDRIGVKAGMDVAVTVESHRAPSEIIAEALGKLAANGKKDEPTDLGENYEEVVEEQPREA